MKRKNSESKNIDIESRGTQRHMLKEREEVFILTEAKEGGGFESVDPKCLTL